MRRECRERFHARAVMHAGIANQWFLWSRWRRKRSQHSRLMRNAQFYVSRKRSMALINKTFWVLVRLEHMTWHELDCLKTTMIVLTQCSGCVLFQTADVVCIPMYWSITTCQCDPAILVFQALGLEDYGKSRSTPRSLMPWLLVSLCQSSHNVRYEGYSAYRLL